MPSPRHSVAYPYEGSRKGRARAVLLLAAWAVALRTARSLKLPSVWHLRRLHLWITLEALRRKGLGEAGGLAAAFREGFVNHNRPVER